eukprot:scaffold219672_cov51-Attheya_sp.AAC.2
MVEFQEVQRHQNSIISEQLKQLLNQSGGNTKQTVTQVEEVCTGKEKRAKTGDPISTDATHPALEARHAIHPGGIVHPGGRVPPHMYGMPASSLAASMAASRMYQAYGGNAYPPPTMTALQQQQQRQYEEAYGLPSEMDYRNEQMATAGYAAKVQASPEGLVT